MVRLISDAKAKKPVIQVSLHHLRRKSGGTVFCQVRGQFSGPVSVHAIFGQQKQTVNNLAHLKQDPESSGKRSGNDIVIGEGDCHLPFAVPPETTDLEIYAADTKSVITGVDVWFVPDPAE